jgi:hypothetical protein
VLKVAGHKGISDFWGGKQRAFVGEILIGREAPHVRRRFPWLQWSDLRVRIRKQRVGAFVKVELRGCCPSSAISMVLGKC